MATITDSFSAGSTKDNLRPFDFRRDLGEVADLVELCFADTLDPDGRDYLSRMRSAAHNASFLKMARSWASTPMTGYVWQQDGRIVGNASLIPYFLFGRRCFLIANVAVHPDYRRQGIGRKLTEKAIETARQKHAPSVWLHVREENQPALDLYKSLGFQEKAVRTTWVAHPDETLQVKQPGVRFISPGRREWPLIREWLTRSYPLELSWHIPFNPNHFQPGLIGMISRFLSNAYVNQWGLTLNGRLAASAAWQVTTGYANAVWLAAPETCEDETIQALLSYVRCHSPTRRSLALEYPARRFGQAIREAGFREQQTLVWMFLPLSQDR